MENTNIPWIGISGIDIDPDMASALNLKDAVGFLVISVAEDGLAFQAGLIGSEKTIEVDEVNYPIGGDIILAVDGNEVRKIDDILVHLQKSKISRGCNNFRNSKRCKDYKYHNYNRCKTKWKLNQYKHKYFKTRRILLLNNQLKGMYLQVTDL